MGATVRSIAASRRFGIPRNCYQKFRYIPDRFLPDKGIDPIDEAGAT